MPKRRSPDYPALGAGSEVNLSLQSPVSYGDTWLDRALVWLRETLDQSEDPTARVAALYAGKVPFLGHRISINPTVVPDEMLETLEHELRHAYEQERGIPLYPESPGTGQAEEYAQRRKAAHRDIRLK